MSNEIYFHWHWDLKSTPEALWPLVADTNRFNRDSGLPALVQLPEQPGQPAENRQLFGRVYGILPIEWEEEPFEWVYPQRFGVRRRYRKGPFLQMRTLTGLVPLPAGGTRLDYQVWIQPRGIFGWLTTSLGVGLVNRVGFGQTFRRYDQLAQQDQSALEMPGRTRFAPGGAARLQTLRLELLERDHPAQAVDRLARLLEQADDLSLSRMRPHALADLWGLPRKPLLELFLSATRLGLLDLRWELLCPDCRTAKQSVSHLDGLSAKAHCSTCQIDFTANFEHAVEVTFRPNPAIRPLPERMDFCVAGPQVTPHITSQQRLEPGEQRSLALALEPGRYRLRALGLPGGQFFQAGQAGATQLRAIVQAEGWPQQEETLAQQAQVDLENATDETRLVVLERLVWSDTAATAAEVTTLQTFRDLFGSEVLRPGEEIRVGSLTLVFTDLRDSTRMYSDIGDAQAFGRVMSHFDILKAASDAESGAIVKLMGDAAMIAFRRPLQALRAMVAAHQALKPLRGDDPAVWLKAGIHSGPCIAVTLNERLDYFGSTVNIAARISHQSQGGDIVISAALAADPEVSAWLSENGQDFPLEAFSAALKGFAEPFDLIRLTL